MINHMDTGRKKEGKRSKALLIITTVYGLLYLWFIISSFTTAETSWVSGTVPFERFDREQIFVKSLFLVFLIGYFAAWKNELVAGTIFIVWWAAMWILEAFVAPKPDGGGGIVMGFPLFILGILFVWRWRTKRKAQETRNSS